MTNPNSPVSATERYSPAQLPKDTIRTVIALAIVALTLGGWIYVMMISSGAFTSRGVP